MWRHSSPNPASRSLAELYIGHAVVCGATLHAGQWQSNSFLKYIREVGSLCDLSTK